MKRLLLAAFIIAVCENIFPQTWLPIGIPEGSGVTDMVYWKGGGAVFGDKLWVTTGSVDWPTGQRGGVFYSSGNGAWNRIGGSAGYYVGRTLEVGQDRNLYASLWRDPALFPADALCRFVPQAPLFEILYQAQAGDNIFSIAVKNSPHTIFAGTRNGVIRSTDNGTTFGYSNTGIPDSAWVYDIAIDSSGVLAVASSKGVFISEDNGDNWEMANGIPSGDTVRTLYFINDSTSGNFNGKTSLGEPISSIHGGTGTNNAALYQSFRENEYLTFLLAFLFANDGEVADLAAAGVINQDKEFAAIYKRRVDRRNISKFGSTGGVYESTDDGVSWNQINNGLPSNPPVSALAIKNIDENSAVLYAGLFNDTTFGAGVYKLGVITDVKEVGNQIPSEYLLEQNFPNPFNPSTTIQFAIPTQSFVQLEIFNALGERVSTLVSENLSPGTYEYEWNAEGLPSGVYLYRLSTENFVQTKKLLLME